MTLPGAIGVSHLRVYPDGGTPHLHTVCTEAYAVVGGRGSVQTVTLAEGFIETPLEAGMLVSFPPGTIHRLVNEGKEPVHAIWFVVGRQSGAGTLHAPDSPAASPGRPRAAAE